MLNFIRWNTFVTRCVLENVCKYYFELLQLVYLKCIKTPRKELRLYLIYHICLKNFFAAVGSLTSYDERSSVGKRVSRLVRVGSRAGYLPPVVFPLGVPHDSALRYHAVLALLRGVGVDWCMHWQVQYRAVIDRYRVVIDIYGTVSSLTGTIACRHWQVQYQAVIDRYRAVINKYSTVSSLICIVSSLTGAVSSLTGTIPWRQQQV